ncbi:MAG: rhodanese-like domain-containing protein [Gemmatimonadota bacterium]
MILKRFYDEQLAQASYLIGCAATGEALVIDPNRDIEQYLEMANAERLRITHVSETHIHADFVSGARELAARTGARLYLSGEGGRDWQYAFRNEPNVQVVHDGDGFRMGNVVVEIMHTPGHTPEHIIFFITDGAAADQPIGVVTGDFVFVGDVGRPDLLEKAAHVAGTMEGSARDLFRSLQRFKTQPDYLQIWPGHGAGSACGKGLSSIPQSTVGYERRFNWAFAIEEEAGFVDLVLTGQPEPPRYFGEMKRINRDGPRVLNANAKPAALGLAELDKLLEQQAVIVDTRRAGEFAAQHIPGTINIPLDRSFTTWAGWLLPYDADFYLLIEAGQPHAIADAVKALARIGLDRVGGYVTDAVLSAWTESGRELQSVPQMHAAELAAQLARGRVAVVDVRGRTEWEAGHLPGVLNIPLGYLVDHIGELAQDRPLVLLCQAGGRSAIAASLLQARGMSRVVNLVGGFAEWQRTGHEIEQTNSALVTV